MERRAFRVPGFPMLLVTIVEAYATVQLFKVYRGQSGPTGLVALVGGLVFLALVTGFFVLSPNESRVVQFFGWYVGTVRRPGFHWTVPFSTKRKISLRVRNFESEDLKVSDLDGNPVQIAPVE